MANAKALMANAKADIKTCPRWDTQSFESLANILKNEGDTFKTYVRKVAENVRGKLLATTRGDRLGLVPATTRPGDTVAFLMGGETPYILRPDPTDGKYTFVGECYMHGFMDGEALVEARKQAQPDYDHSDTSWLHRLHEGPLPFETSTFTLK